MRHDPALDAPTFGDLLGRMRRARAMTQEGLAERAGVSVRAISDLERGARSHPYRETANLLADALGLTGSDRATFLATARHPLSPAGLMASKPREPRLPRPLTRLIGRDDARRAIAGLLCDERVRLLTLSGPGGVGKTRVAIAVANDLAAAFRDGVIFVDLAPLTESSQVVPAIAAALELADHGAIPLLEAVRRRLSTRQMLVVLDNFEHLLPAAQIVSDLLHAAPDVQTLVTSRAALRLHGECEYPVVPLRTPDSHAPMSPAELADWAAIQLFVERAGAAQPGFQLNDENANDVVAICQRLDGLPLALELAAVRIKMLPPAPLLARLERRFSLLTAGTRDAPPRQRTLEAAIAWSYDLLDPAQQALLRCLTVFAGGWTLEAAESVGSRRGVSDVLGAFAALIEQSLVVREDAGSTPRYRLLETIREFALAQLVAEGEEERARRAHAHYLLQFAEENNLEQLDSEVGIRIDHLNADAANLRAGIDWALKHYPDLALSVLAALGPFWIFKGRPTGRDLLGRAIKTGVGANRRERAWVLQQAAWLETLIPDYARAEPLLEELRPLAARLGDARLMTHVQMCDGIIAVSRGEVDRATALLSDAVAQFESRGDLWGTMMCLTELGIAACGWSDPAASATYFERIGAMCGAHALPSLYQTHYLGNLAYAYQQLGRHEEAMEACLAALRHARAAGDSYYEAGARLTLARLLLDRGEIDQALSHSPEIAESLGFYWEMGDRWDLIPALEFVAALMAASGHAEPAARLLGAVAPLRAALSYPINTAERAALDHQVADITAVLGEPAFKQAWRVGQAQPLERAVIEARSLLTTLAS